MSEPIDADEQFSRFIAAIKANDLRTVEDILLQVDSSISNRLESQFRQPALYFAALVDGDEAAAELIKLLVRNGANLQFKDHNEQTILFYVCREGKEKCAELLLSHGLSLDTLDVYGQTPLFYAVSENRLDIVNKYATKERVNHVDKLARQTPIYYAARRGHLEMCRLLVERGTELALLDAHNKTVVEYAKKAKFHELTEYLSTQLRKVKETSRPEENEKKVVRKNKDEVLRDSKQTYRIVFYTDKGEPRDITEEEARALLQQRPELAAYLNNPDSIPPEGLAATENETWEKIASKILAQCGRLKGAYYFMEPVDPVKFNIMDYFDIVTQPMDLGTIRRKLTHNCYRSAADFISDMNLIWQNSYRYNGQNHVVSKCGKELENAFNDMVMREGLQRYLSPQE